MRLLTPPGVEGDLLEFRALLSAAGDDEQSLHASAELHFEYANDSAVAAALPHREVMKRYAAVRVADTANEALKLERAGKRQQASAMLSQEVMLNVSVMEKGEIDRYNQLAERMKRGMEEHDRKISHINNYNIKRTRLEE